MLTPSQNVAIERAVAFLRAANAQFKIICAGETVLDTLPPPAPAAVERKKRVFVNDFAATTQYIVLLKALQPGGTLVLQRDQFPVLATNKAWASFKSSVASYCNRLFGKDKWVIGTDSLQSRVEVLRVE